MPRSGISAASVKASLRDRYAAPEWAILFEVADRTGTGASRRVDAVAMNFYPSRGLEVHGFEIKVSRSDWRRELVDPAKAEANFGACDRRWLVAPPGVVTRANCGRPGGISTWTSRPGRCARSWPRSKSKPMRGRGRSSLPCSGAHPNQRPPLLRSGLRRQFGPTHGRCCNDFRVTMKEHFGPLTWLEIECVPVLPQLALFWKSDLSIAIARKAFPVVSETAESDLQICLGARFAAWAVRSNRWRGLVLRT